MKQLPDGKVSYGVASHFLTINMIHLNTSIPGVVLPIVIAL